ncbi:MAG: hypothetical protein AB6733_20630 [Clostridiaceae bacterium]
MNVKKISIIIGKIEKLFSLRSIRKYELKQEVKIILDISLITYICCFLFLIVMKSEQDYSKLTYGPIILVLYFFILILFFINTIFLTDTHKKERLVLKNLIRLEFILRFLMFIFVFSNIKAIGIDINIKTKFLVLIGQCIISLLIITYMYNKVKNHKINIDDYKYTLEFTQKDIEDYNNKRDYISFLGIMLYLYSITGVEIKLSCMVLKFMAFYFCSKFIIGKLKVYYNIEKINSHISKIISCMVIGFAINIFGVYIADIYFKNISKVNYYSIRDILGLVAILFALPLFKEYVRLGNRMRELEDYIKKIKKQ